MKTTSIFPNITNAMRNTGYTIAQLSEEIGIGRPALSEKLSGKYKFTFDEALKIRDVLTPGANVEELFKKTVLCATL